MEIQSWKTAIHRIKPSAPCLKIEPFLKKDFKILDFGCGYGYDVNYLKNKNFEINGYDKYLKPYTDKKILAENYDVIFCNYVLNTIPYEERIEVLKNIKKMINENGEIFISVRSKNRTKNNKSHLDGIITNKNTFQKYFSKEEFEELVYTIFDDYYLTYLNIGYDNLLIRLKRCNNESYKDRFTK